MRSIAESTRPGYRGQLGKKLAMLLFVLAICVPAAGAASINIDLKTADSFGVLAGLGVTSSDSNTVVNGDVGSDPTPTITGFPPGVVKGILYDKASAVVTKAKTDLTTAYSDANKIVADSNKEPNTALPLDPNVYAFASSANLTGTLTLNGGGNSSAKWLFKIPAALTTGPNFAVLLTGGASAKNVFWQVGTSATIDANNVFAGNILASTGITLKGGTLNGRALAISGSVTISGAETINVPDYVLGYDPNDPNAPREAILVYKVKQSSLKGWQLDFNDSSRSVDIDEEDPCDPNQQPPLNAEWDTTTLPTAQPSSSKIAGYIVMDVNLSTFLINDIDPNGDPNTITTAHDAAAMSDGAALIIINKKTGKTSGSYRVIYNTLMANADKTAWVIDANSGSIVHNGIFKAEVVKNKKGKVMAKKTLCVFDLDAAVSSSKGTDVNDVRTWDRKDWGWDFSTMTGALSKVDVDDSGHKVLVPKSLKGTAMDVNGNTIVGTRIIEENLDPNDLNDIKTTVTTINRARTEDVFFGKASMALDVKLTRKANAGPVKWTTLSAIGEIIKLLPSTYTEVQVANAVDPESDD